MNIKKMLLVGAAVLALAAVAVPVSLATTGHWKDGGAEVKTKFELSLTGAETFEIPTESGMDCEVHAVLTSEGGTSAKITKWEIKTAGCKGFGSFASCTLSSTTINGLPWTVDVNTTNLTVTGVSITRVFKTGCPVK